MAASTYAWTERKIQKWVKQGRGQGAGADYKGWLRVQDVPSSGFSHRVWCELTRRIHHYLSYLEYQAHVWSLFQRGVIDIREAYPLERAETRSVAAKLGIAHPRYPRTAIDTVMTTDLLLTKLVDGALSYVALAVKPSSELAKPRVVEKLSIERTYWHDRGVASYVFTERQMPQVLIRNYERIRFALNLTMHPGFSVSGARSLQAELLRHMAQRNDATYEAFCTEFDKRLGLETGDAHYLLSNLMGHGVIAYDMRKPWDVRCRLGDLLINPSGFESIAKSEDMFA